MGQNITQLAANMDKARRALLDARASVRWREKDLVSARNALLDELGQETSAEAAAQKTKRRKPVFLLNDGDVERARVYCTNMGNMLGAVDARHISSLLKKEPRYCGRVLVRLGAMGVLERGGEVVGLPPQWRLKTEKAAA